MAGGDGGRYARLDRLNDKAKQLLAKGEWRRAIRVYERFPGLARPDELHPSYYNNYALCYEGLGEPERALEILAPNLQPAAELSPFAHALAARLLARLNQRGEAEKEYREATAEFAPKGSGNTGG